MGLVVIRASILQLACKREMMDGYQDLGLCAVWGFVPGWVGAGGEWLQCWDVRFRV